MVLSLPASDKPGAARGNGVKLRLSSAFPRVPGSPFLMKKIPSKTLLVISALGKDRPGLVNEFSRTVLDNGCSIEDSRMTVLGSEFAILMMVSGHWNNVAKLEQMLGRLRTGLDMTIQSRRTEPRQPHGDAIPYSAEVIALDNPGIVNQLARFFSERGINIHDLYTGSYFAPHTGTRMFSLNMSLEIPAETHICTLREQFMDFCDSLNLDAVMEPVK